MKTSFVAFALAVVCMGCRGPARMGYMDSADNVFASPERVSQAEKRRSVADALARMQTDAAFMSVYAAAKNRRMGALPVVAIRPFENNTGDGVDDARATGAIYKTCLTALRKTGLFVLKDDTRAMALIDRVKAGNNNGENVNALGNFGSYDSPDFYLQGELVSNMDDDVAERRRVFTHDLNLVMLDAVGSNVAWSETVEVVKYAR